MLWCSSGLRLLQLLWLRWRHLHAALARMQRAIFDRERGLLLRRGPQWRCAWQWRLGDRRGRRGHGALQWCRGRAERDAGIELLLLFLLLPSLLLLLLLCCCAFSLVHVTERIRWNSASHRRQRCRMRCGCGSGSVQ
jgi:hypothetical protein